LQPAVGWLLTENRAKIKVAFVPRGECIAHSEFHVLRMFIMIMTG
jgi:hypothetical protein